MLGARQRASLLLSDFPVALLQPLFRAMPALEHAAPAVGTAPVTTLPPTGKLLVSGLTKANLRVRTVLWRVW